MNEKHSKCLIIVGMHRSGTSFTASLLQQSGLNIGDNLMAAGVGNELGHFENEDFYQFHQRILKERKQDSDGWSLASVDTLSADELKEAQELVNASKAEQWGWKDPRSTLFLNIWQKIIPDASFLFIYRKPWEVVESLFRRNTDVEIMQKPFLAIQNWQFYNQHILDFFEKNKDKSLLIEIENIMQQSNTVIDLINNHLGFTLNDNIETLFDHTKFKNKLNKTQQFFCEIIFPECISLYKMLQKESSIQSLYEYKSDNNKKESLIHWWYDATQLARLNKEYIGKAGNVHALEVENEELKNKNEYLNTVNNDLQLINNDLQHNFNSIRYSKWWKIRLLIKRFLGK